MILNITQNDNQFRCSLPAVFVQNITNMYGAKGESWLKKLPVQIRKIANKWDLENLKPLECLTYNYVIQGTRHNLPIILKISFNSEDLIKEVKALKAFSSKVVVKIIAYEDNCLLLEQIIPGYTLKTYLNDRPNKALEIMCNVTSQLHQSQSKQYNCDDFPLIQNQLTEFEKWLEKYNKNIDRVFQQQNVFKTYLIKAIELRKRLLQEPLPQILTHGDLHHNNVLWNGQSWIIIDPKGIIGPAISEMWAFIIDFKQDTEYIAKFFNYDLLFLRKWYFMRIILSICWCLKDNSSPQFFFNIALKTFKYIS